MAAPQVKDLIGKRCLIVGDVGSGKTGLTARYLKDLLGLVHGPVLVLDMAPAARLKDGSLVGPPLDLPEAGNLALVQIKTVPPRLTTEDEEERLNIARANAETIEEKGLSLLLEGGFHAAVLNDASLYLQAREAGELFSYLEDVPTAIVNAYLGEYFGASPFSRRERRRVEELSGLMDLTVRL